MYNHESGKPKTMTISKKQFKVVFVEREDEDYVPHRLPDLIPGSCYFFHSSEFPCGINTLLNSECVGELRTKLKRQIMNW